MTLQIPSNLSRDRRSPGSGANEDWFLRLKKDLHQRLITGMDLSTVRKLDDYELRRELRAALEELTDSCGNLLSVDEREQLVSEVLDETLGLGPLDPLMRDPTVTDVLINGPKVVYVERRGRLEPSNVAFNDEQHLLEIVQRIASRVGRRLDESNPMVDARLEDGSRVNAVIRPLALDGALVSIRRFGNRPLDAADLLARKSATREMIAFLVACVRSRMNIIISGGTGSGKTTFLNLLSSFIPEGERIVSIEDAAELRLQQPHVARMETRPENVEGKGEVTARDLVRNALRMRPDRIIVGECRGAETFDMLQSMTTGHDGSLSTIHANDARDALSRLELLSSLAGGNLPLRFIQRLIVSAVNIVVHCERLSGGARKVVQISEITGLDGETINMHDVFHFEQTGLDANHAAKGQFHATGIQPRCLGRIQACGIQLPPDLFERRVLEHERIDAVGYIGER
ncbi:MAG: CpaF family protein [Planctomycetaceae bacterium]|nr:CpaF family protein [Planctomycetaceae bacterium]